MVHYVTKTARPVEYAPGPMAGLDPATGLPYAQPGSATFAAQYNPATDRSLSPDERAAAMQAQAQQKQAEQDAAVAAFKATGSAPGWVCVEHPAADTSTGAPLGGRKRLVKESDAVVLVESFGFRVVTTQ